MTRRWRKANSNSRSLVETNRQIAPWPWRLRYERIPSDAESSQRQSAIGKRNRRSQRGRRLSDATKVRTRLTGGGSNRS